MLRCIIPQLRRGVQHCSAPAFSLQCPAAAGPHQWLKMAATSSTVRADCRSIWPAGHPVVDLLVWKDKATICKRDLSYQLSSLAAGTAHEDHGMHVPSALTLDSCIQTVKHTEGMRLAGSCCRPSFAVPCSSMPIHQKCHASHHCCVWRSRVQARPQACRRSCWSQPWRWMPLFVSRTPRKLRHCYQMMW